LAREGIELTKWWYANPTEFQEKFMAKFYPEISEYKAYQYQGPYGKVYAFEMFKDGKFYDNSVQMYEKDYYECLEKGKFREAM
jgi:hypothetical protein